MAQSITIPVNDSFDLQMACHRLADIYRQKGYAVTYFNNVGGGMSLDFQKNNEGINKVIGTVEGLRLNLIETGQDGGRVLFVNYTDEAWTDKIISFILGWFCCWLTWIGCGIGIYRQVQLPKNINNDLTFLCAQGSQE